MAKFHFNGTDSIWFESPLLSKRPLHFVDRKSETFALKRWKARRQRRLRRVQLGLESSETQHSAFYVPSVFPKGNTAC